MVRTLRRRVRPFPPRTRRPGKGRYNDWYREPPSRPHLCVNAVLRGDRLIEGRIVVPSACNIPEIALPKCLAREASTSGKCLNRHFVEAFALCLGSPTKGAVDGIRHIADCVLHAFIVGNAG